jgi:hypothetical protein
MDITQEQVEFLRKQHVQFALPMYGGICHECVMTSMIKFAIYAQRIGMPFSLDTMINESLIQRARNHLVAKFLENGVATHLMFIDSDIGFEPDHIFKLLLHDKDIIGGLYPKKALPPDYVVNVSPEAVDENGQVKSVDGLIPVSRLGTGFMLIKREVFEKHMAAYPQSKFTNNIGLDPKFNKWCYTFFDCWITQDVNREMVSEDWGFTIKSRVIGLQAYADPTIRLNHSGTFVFPGDPTALYNSMGLKLETNPHLVPRIAMRKDEISDDSAKLMIQPDMDALSAYLVKKQQENDAKTLDGDKTKTDEADKLLPTNRVVLEKVAKITDVAPPKLNEKPKKG